jgi:hypothetical protein
MPGQRGIGSAGHRDQRHAEALEHGQDDGELLDFAAVRDREHQVDRLDHAEIAVARLRRMHEHRRRPRRCESGRDLAADMAALAHAHDDHAAPHLEDFRTAATKLAPTRCLRPSTASASISKVIRARASIASGSAAEARSGGSSSRDFIGQGLGSLN